MSFFLLLRAELLWIIFLLYSPIKKIFSILLTKGSSKCILKTSDSQAFCIMCQCSFLKKVKGGRNLEYRVDLEWECSGKIPRIGSFETDFGSICVAFPISCILVFACFLRSESVYSGNGLIFREVKRKFPVRNN